jgi:uncharacterized protein
MADGPTYPGVYVDELQPGPGEIAGVDTSTAAFVDRFSRGPIDTAVRVAGMADLAREFGGLDGTSEASYAVHQFFLNGGSQAWVVRVDGDGPLDAATLIGDRAARTGVFALEDADTFNILCIPAAASLSTGMQEVITAATAYCRERRAFMIVDVPPTVTDAPGMQTWMAANQVLRDPSAAVYFPRPMIPDPLDGFRERSVGASGTMAGLYARTDSTRGVWKTPAGTDAQLRGVTGLGYALRDDEDGALAALGISTLRGFTVYGNVCWGARTLDGADERASEWKYIPVRRLALFLEESLYRGTKWVVFEPNDETTWSKVRLRVDSFMRGLFQNGAFQGRTPKDAYFVKCDPETTTQNDIEQGLMNILVGFAPLKPAEFVILTIQQAAGHTER